MSERMMGSLEVTRILAGRARGCVESNHPMRLLFSMVKANGVDDVELVPEFAHQAEQRLVRFACFFLGAAIQFHIVDRFVLLSLQLEAKLGKLPSCIGLGGRQGTEQGSQR